MADRNHARHVDGARLGDLDPQADPRGGIIAILIGLMQPTLPPAPISSAVGRATNPSNDK